MQLRSLLIPHLQPEPHVGAPGRPVAHKCVHHVADPKDRRFVQLGRIVRGSVAGDIQAFAVHRQVVHKKVVVLAAGFRRVTVAGVAVGDVVLDGDKVRVVDEDTPLVAIANDVLGDERVGVTGFVEVDRVPTELASLPEPAEGHPLDRLDDIGCVKDDAVRPDIFGFFRALEGYPAAQEGDLGGEHRFTGSGLGGVDLLYGFLKSDLFPCDGSDRVPDVTPVPHFVSRDQQLVALGDAGRKGGIDGQRPAGLIGILQSGPGRAVRIDGTDVELACCSNRE